MSVTYVVLACFACNCNSKFKCVQSRPKAHWGNLKISTKNCMKNYLWQRYYPKVWHVVIGPVCHCHMDLQMWHTVKFLWHDMFPEVLLVTRQCSLTPDQCGASTRGTKDALSQLCCKERIILFGWIERLRRETWTRTRTRFTRGGAKESRDFYPPLTLTHGRELVLCFDFGINSELVPE